MSQINLTNRPLPISALEIDKQPGASVTELLITLGRT